MATTTPARRPVRPEPELREEQPYVEPTRPRRTGRMLLVVLAVWLVLFAALRGRQTLDLGFQDLTGFHEWLNRVRDWVQLHGPGNWFLGGVLGGIGRFFTSLVTALQKLVSVPAFPRPVPQVGWLGVVAVAAWFSWVVAGLRSAVLVVLSLMLFGIWGFWSTSDTDPNPDALDLLIVTLVAVAVCVVVGVPIGIAMARSSRVSGLVTPLLDGMQTLPSFAYLTPFALFFGIGSGTAVVVTLIYAIPPLIRITELGVRSVPATTVEAAWSMGLTTSQMLRRVQLPMARRTIILGVNQCMMAALSMATIAALVNGPGLGKDVQAGLQSQNIGQAALPGLAIVLMAIMLDRTTTAAGAGADTLGRRTAGGGSSWRDAVLRRLPGWASEPAGRGGARRATGSGRWALRALWLAPVLVALYLSRTYLGLARFPGRARWPFIAPIDGPTLVRVINDFSGWLINGVDTVTLAVKNDLTDVVINPLQALVADSPWWVVALVLLTLAQVLGGWRAAAVTAVCLAVVLGVGLWNDTMVTLSMTVVATTLVMVIAVVLGVAMSRSRRTDVVVRPFLDAFQVIPPFVYLVPALALFGVGRFTAIIAAVAYAVPIATKLVADGIRGVPEPTVEAARSAGASTWQLITKVQLPMARESLVLATNQGLLYVLAMVVIGGLVGGGSLGYLVVSGFSQDQLFGKGLAAGLAITALGVMLDRTARHAAARSGR